MASVKTGQEKVALWQKMQRLHAHYEKTGVMYLDSIHIRIDALKFWRDSYPNTPPSRINAYNDRIKFYEALRDNAQQGIE